ncbi:MAG: transcription termination/antitermination protein NusG [Clostridia bacterium]|nr:transcription termination/antitermination protein NusG [Clostridia bacterium]MBR3196457.1 transcription termination/antitermination protein NusG [Clostridia bacterium]
MSEKIESAEVLEETKREDPEDSLWYVVHTYSGYENKVKANLEKMIENRGLQNLIQEVNVPLEEVVEVRNGKRKSVARKIFPGYVMVKMVMTDESWYIVRNTRGVTGFVGPGSKPIPLTEEEVNSMGVDKTIIRIDFEEGQSVRVMDGPLEGFVGVVQKVNREEQKVRVMVSMFGRETPVDLDFLQAQKIED